MAHLYMRPPVKNHEAAVKNIMVALERNQGPTANAGYVDSLHKMLAIYLNGGR